jgi:hypothetical protein
MKTGFFFCTLFIFFTFSTFAQSLYFDFGNNSSAGWGIRTGIGPILNIPVYFVGEFSALHFNTENEGNGIGFLGMGAVYYPISFIQLGLSFGLAPIIQNPNDQLHSGMSFSFAFDIGGRNVGFLLGTKGFLAFNENINFSGPGYFIGIANRKRVAKPLSE